MANSKIYINVNKIQSYEQSEYGVCIASTSNFSTDGILTKERSTIIRTDNNITYIVKGFLSPPVDNQMRFIELIASNVLNQTTKEVRARTQTSAKLT